ncbi:MAG: hypothetical protein ACLQVY_16420 [Limisphaerales bacterium]
MGQQLNEAQRRAARAGGDQLNDEPELSGKSIAIIAAASLGLFVVIYLAFIQ